MKGNGYKSNTNNRKAIGESSDARCPRGWNCIFKVRAQAVAIQNLTLAKRTIAAMEQEKLNFE